VDQRLEPTSTDAGRKQVAVSQKKRMEECEKKTSEMKLKENQKENGEKEEFDGENACAEKEKNNAENALWAIEEGGKRDPEKERNVADDKNSSERKENKEERKKKHDKNEVEENKSETKNNDDYGGRKCIEDNEEKTGKDGVSRKITSKRKKGRRREGMVKDIKREDISSKGVTGIM
jgi:hypothetical protein